MDIRNELFWYISDGEPRPDNGYIVSAITGQGSASASADALKQFEVME